MPRVPVLILLIGVIASLAAQEAKKEPLTPSELAKMPAWRRTLQGVDAKKAEGLKNKKEAAEIAGQFENAQKYADELHALRELVQGSDHWETIDAAFDAEFVRIFSKLGLKDRDRLQRTQLLNQEVVQLWRQGRSREAIPKAEESVKIRSELLKDSHPLTATSLLNLASQYEKVSDHAAAERVYLQATNALKKSVGDFHPLQATCLGNLASLYSEMGLYAKAESISVQARDIRKQVLGENHPDYAFSLSNLATLYLDMGEYAKAELLLLRSNDILKNLVGEDETGFAASLNNLASLYSAKGEYVQAAPLFRQASEIIKRQLGENHPNYAAGLNNLAMMYLKMGDFTTAEPLFIQSVNSTRLVQGENHPVYASRLNNLGLLYSEMGEPARALPLYLQARDIRRKALGENHAAYANSLGNLATIYNEIGEPSKAEPLYLQAQDIRRKVLGESHPDYAVSLNNLAVFYSDLGEPSKAEPLYLQAREIRRKVLGQNNPDYATSLNNLAMLYLKTGDSGRAVPLLRECTASYEMSRLSRAAGLQRALGGELGNPYELLAVVFAQLGKPQAAYDALERDLARATLDEQAARRGNSLKPGQLAKQTEIRSRLAAIEPRIGKLFDQIDPKEAEQKELRSLSEERDKWNLALAALAVEVSQQEVSDLGAIQKALTAEQAILVWVDAPFGKGRGRVEEHWVCVIRSSGDPHWVRLPSTGEKGTWSKEDSALTGKLRAALTKSATASEVSALVAKVHSQRIVPVLKHLDGVKTLYVVGVKDMAGIPVDVLVPEYVVSYIPSGSFLARRGKSPDKPTTLLALGDPVFPKSKEVKIATALPPGGLLITQVVPEGAAAKAGLKANDVLVSYGSTKLESFEQLGKLIAEKANEKEVTIQFWREAEDKVVTREMASGRLGVLLDKQPAREAIPARRQSNEMLAKLSRGGNWEELPGTQVELEELGKLFPKESVARLTRSHASEPELEAMRKKGDLTKFRYLHFATHGEANNVRAFDSKLILAQDRAKELLAKPGEPLMDNELSAREVLDYWKLDSDLVTLSACETALGKSGGGDGMLGFAHAFLLAGSRAVCLSLWKVDDTATALLMDRFYRNLLGKRKDGAKPMGKAAALAEAKTWLRNLTVAEATVRLGTLTDGVSRGGRPAREVIGQVPTAKEAKDAKPYTHPKYWAAFILIGDPD